MNESFGLRRSIQVQGIVFTLLFLAAAVGCAGLFLFDEPEKHGFEDAHSVAIVACSGIAVFGGMALISAYMLIAYHVERFSIAGTRISVRSVFQQRQFDQSEVDKLTWKTNPIDGQLVFHVVNRKARLELHGFRREDRLRMVRLLRQLIPEAKQEGWPLFCLKIALPLRNRCEPQSILENPCSRDEVFIMRWRYDRLFLALLPLTIIGAVAAWWWTGWISQFFAISGFAIFIWLMLRYSVPRKGHRQRRMTADTNLIVLWSVFVPLGLSMFAMPVAVMAGATRDQACTASLVILGPVLPFVLYWLYREERTRRAKDEIAAVSAVEEWEKAEHAL